MYLFDLQCFELLCRRRRCFIIAKIKVAFQNFEKEERLKKILL
jgi:hypothetical protein